jgi:hypothetical protein
LRRDEKQAWKVFAPALQMVKSFQRCGEVFYQAMGEENDPPGWLHLCAGYW